MSPTLNQTHFTRAREGSRVNQSGILRRSFHFERQSRMYMRLRVYVSQRGLCASAATSTFSTRVGNFPRSSAVLRSLFFLSFILLLSSSSSILFFSFLTLRTNARFSKRSIFGRCMAVPAARGKISESTLGQLVSMGTSSRHITKVCSFSLKSNYAESESEPEKIHVGVRRVKLEAGFWPDRRRFQDFSQTRPSTTRDFVNWTRKTSVFDSSSQVQARLHNSAMT